MTTLTRSLFLVAAAFFVFDLAEYKQMHVMAQTTTPPAVTNPAYVPDPPPPANIQVYWANEHPGCTMPNPDFKMGEQHTATFTAAMQGQLNAVPLTFAVTLRHVRSPRGQAQTIPDAIIIMFPLDPKAPCPTITWK